jgi:2-methylcitrate dehydratase PrpD
MLVDMDDPGMGVAGRAAVVEVVLSDGRILSQRVEGPKGEPAFPLSDAELERKFRSLATMALDPVEVDRLATEIANFENSSAAAVMALCKASQAERIGVDVAE